MRLSLGETRPTFGLGLTTMRRLAVAATPLNRNAGRFPDRL